MFSVYISCPSALTLSNLKLYKTLAVKNTFIHVNEKLQPRLTCNHLWTTRPWPAPGCSNPSPFYACHAGYWGQATGCQRVSLLDYKSRSSLSPKITLLKKRVAKLKECNAYISTWNAARGRYIYFAGCRLQVETTFGLAVDLQPATYFPATCKISLPRRE